MVGSEDTDPINDANGDKKSVFGFSAVSCSICLNVVNDNGERSTAKLQCGHEFHLDCIGSAFNMKGAMQCPNCRKVERGQWLFANGSACAIPEIGVDDWIPNEDPHESSYSEMPFGVHWCPFSGLTFHSSFEEVEFPSTTFTDLHGNHAMITERTAAPSLAHSYVAHVRTVPPSSSNSSENIDDPNSRHRWNAQSGHNEIYAHNTFPSTNIQYQSWGCHTPPFSTNRSRIDGGDQASVHLATLQSTRAESDTIATSGSFMHPFRYSQGSVSRAGESSSISSIVNPGSTPWSHERIQVSHASHHQHQPSDITGIPSSISTGLRRFTVPRGFPLLVPAVSQSARSGGFYIVPPSVSSGRYLYEAENSLLNYHVHAWERQQRSHFPFISIDRDSGWGPFHHVTGGSDSSSRSGNFWPMH